MAHYAGIDLGATNLRAQVVADDGGPLGEDRRRTPGTREGIEAAIREALGAACTAAGLDPDDLAAVGVGSMGPLDRDAGAVVGPSNVAADRVAVVAAVESVVDCPVVLHNDAIAAAIGEQFFTDAPPNAVYLTLSSGVGAGAVVDGHVLEGHRGNAAEVGHFVVEPGGRACGCGGHGHWEAYCSGSAIPRFARERHRAGVATALDLDGLTAADIFAAPDDSLAADVLDRVAEYNVQGVAALSHAYAPELVSVGGAVARNNESLVLDPVCERLAAHLAVPAPTVRLTPLGDAAVLRGAVATALRLDGAGSDRVDHN
jgi:glucokinase